MEYGKPVVVITESLFLTEQEVPGMFEAEASSKGTIRTLPKKIKTIPHGLGIREDLITAR